MSSKISFLIGMVAIGLSGCGPKTRQDFDSARYRETCNQRCLKDFGTPVSTVGYMTGDCYCE